MVVAAASKPAAGARTALAVGYVPRGACRQVFLRRDPEVCISGPAGTGKSRACLEKLNAAADKYPGSRHLLCRKTRESLTQSALVTFEKHVLLPSWGITLHHESQEYRYPNGSIVAVGGLDKASRVLSTDWDTVYVQEATEISEDDAEILTTRLRNGRLPYQQLLMDCNPDSPYHWLKRRADRGQTVMLESRHEDNPTVTPEYLAKLDALTGVRHKRLRLGLWVAAEGQIYEDWDRAVHLLDRFEIPKWWPRYLAVDFGYTNPFVCQWWARDDDGRLYRYRELYGTQTLVEDWATRILVANRGERIQAVVCDWDAEGRATLERHLKCQTTPAIKDVSNGIQAVQARLRKAGDGKSRLFLLRGSLVQRDPLLDERKLPTCSEEEVESYVWAQAQDGRPEKEEPLKLNDHGMDAMRYLVASMDLATVQRPTRMKMV